MKKRRCPMIQTCPKCGHMRINHPAQDKSVCPVPAEVTERLRQFKEENGKQWKAKLRRLWTSGQDEGLLRQARNYIGPSRIDKITL